MPGIRRGEIYRQKIKPPTEGNGKPTEPLDPIREDNKGRPVLIVSANPLNSGRTVMVARITSAQIVERAAKPTCVHFDALSVGLSKDSVVNCADVSLMRVGDLQTNRAVGKLGDDVMEEIGEALKISLGVVPWPSQTPSHA